jgi:hypothetical protein
MDRFTENTDRITRLEEQLNKILGWVETEKTHAKYFTDLYKRVEQIEDQLRSNKQWRVEVLEVPKPAGTFTQFDDPQEDIYTEKDGNPMPSKASTSQIFEGKGIATKNDTITISRKIVEEWLNANKTFYFNDMVKELRRSLNA